MRDDVAPLVRETVYGSRKRLSWIVDRLRPDDDVLEVGCGTGYMICRPLARLGYRVRGVDLDASSVAHGRELLAAEGLDPEVLSVGDLQSIEGRPSVIIVSEVLEHLHDAELDALLGEIRARLAPGGRLLVTVPNGYGWFELEHFLWWKARVGQLLFRSGLCHLVDKTKIRYLGPEAVVAGPPSTLSSTPHVQRFTLSSIQKRLQQAGFHVTDARGSVAVSGPFSNMFFGGVEPVLQANARWGDRVGRLASGYFVACKAP